MESSREAPELRIDSVATTRGLHDVAGVRRGYVPGFNAVIGGTMLASRELGWEVFGIQDGYDGLLFFDRSPGGGVVPLTPGDLREVVTSDGCISLCTWLGSWPTATSR